MGRRIFCLAFFACSLFSWAQMAKVYTTTANGSRQLALTTQKMGTQAGNLIVLKPDVRYQSVDGFGYAVTYSSCYNLLHMSARDRHAFLERTFSPTVGYGCSYVRVSIGCNDFSSTEYTLCDKQGLENFGLHTDEKEYVIPILQEILSINPSVKVIGAPWTCPRWMKVTSANGTNPHNSWTGGHLNPRYRATYAQYFVKFVQAFAQNGIPVYAVTPQNEPLNAGNCASLVMNWDEQAEFVKELAPAFKHAGLDTRIYLFDHNYNYDNKAGQTDYPIKVYNALSPDMEGSELVVGSAWHDYGGSNTELEDIYQQAPDKELIFTESSIGTWNDGRNLSARLVSDMNNIVLGCVNRRCRAVLVWNLMLDLKRGPNLDGGCQTCYGAVDIDDEDYHTITPNSHYFIISHMSSVVQPGAERIGYSGSVSNVSLACFANPDGTYAAVASNNGNSQVTVSFGVPDLGFAVVKIPAKSVVSVQMGESFSQPVYTIGDQQMTRSSLGSYTLELDMRQGESYATNFLADAEDWYVDPDFFSLDGQGNLTLLALDGRFRILVDTFERSLVVRPVQDPLNEEGQGAIYAFGTTGSIGKPYHIAGTRWDVSRAIPMAEHQDQVYTLTLTAGEQLNASAFDFIFCGDPATQSPVFLGSSNSQFRITTGNIYMGMGSGRAGTSANGHMYKRAASSSFPQGQMFRLTLDLRPGLGASVLDVEKLDATTVRDIIPSFPLVPAGIYDLQGRCVGFSDQGLRPGIYIRNGKKFFIH